MEIRNYAPVIIPTLNRFEHLKRCLESLEKCTGADKTEVFVALDYPPSEKYVDGWNKIDKYLFSKEKQNGFKELHVVRRKHNYGIGTIEDNYNTLLNEITKKYDRYIGTEDDNVFGKSYLQYVNWGLEHYKDDDSVYAICAYNHPLEMPAVSNDANYFFIRDFGPWAPGMWTKKAYPLSLSEVDKLIKNPKVLDYSLKKRLGLLPALLNMKKTGIMCGDGYYLASMVVNDQYCVYPVKTFVLNKGWDGTGLHGGVVPAYLNQTMDENYCPEKFIRTNKEEEDKIQERYLAYWGKYSKWYQILIDYIIIYCYKFTGKYLDLYSVKNSLKKYVRRRFLYIC